MTKIYSDHNLIESLDASCGPALHSKRHDLRRHSLPFDWVQSPSLQYERAGSYHLRDTLLQSYDHSFF
ncbi:DUF1796 family putative cysteine peptidase [Peribacillus muralis]|uniref:DUF1796 family putative cysteine peptidase n=1 Tax=Peribacillus muralis TaxID=264697 RepID=UPI00128F8085|nr:DUF1796 family putative cysteine peptidase [Peribacillus muralis]